MHWDTYQMMNDERIRTLQGEARRDRLARDAAGERGQKDGTILGRIGSMLRVLLIGPFSAPANASAPGDTYRG